ncbi:MAG: RHS repeat-associated core domain-containing protein [Candidatus Omnitrophota bacterium]|jgi:RHS repeat-associated protein
MKLADNFFFKRIKNILASGIFLFCLFAADFCLAADIDASGHYEGQITLTGVNHHIKYTYEYSDGTKTAREEDTLSKMSTPYNLDVTQSADGTLYGTGSTSDNPGGWTHTLTGKVNGNDVNLKLTTVFTWPKDDMYSIKATFVYDFSGTVSPPYLTGTLNLVYSGYSEAYYYQQPGGPQVYLTTLYRDETGFLATPYSFPLPTPSLDTVITSSPPASGTSTTAAFAFEAKNAINGVAGFYYQLDSRPQVYTTNATVTFSNLAVGNHTFSVAAKDNNGNIDSSPATCAFIIKSGQVNPTANSEAKGTSKDENQTTKDPIYVTTGNMYVNTNDIKIAGKGLDFDFTRTYNSRDSYSGPLGYGWTHSYNVFLTYDADNKLAKIRDGEGRELIFTDNLDNTFISQRGEYSTLTKNSTGYIWRLKTGIQFYFNTAGKLVKIVDRNSNAILLSYNSSNKLVKITDTTARAVNITYDTSGRIISITNPLSKIYKYAYDASGNLATVTDPLNNKITYIYNSVHNLTKKTLPNGKVVTFTYDSSDRCTSSSGENNYEKETLTFQPQYKRTFVTNSKGYQATYYYSSDYQITKIIDALGNSTTSAWDENLNCVSRADALGRTVRMGYDAKGNLIKIIDPLNNITNFTYEPTFCNLTSKTDALGNVTNYYYDSKGNLTKVINPLGASTSYQYATGGLVSAIINANGKKISFTYDKYGNVASVKDLAGITTKSTYDVLGNKITSTDPRGNVTRHYYDTISRLIKILLPDKTSTNLFTYDGVDNLTSKTDALGRKTTYVYNAANKVKTITDALGGVITNNYDTEGNLISIKDQKNNTTTFSYDALNRLIAKTDAANYKWQYFYDAASNRVKEIDPKGQTTTYNYDELNRLESFNAPEITVSYNYDNLGRIVSMLDWQGTTYYSYDVLGQLLEIDGPLSNDVIKYTYDLVGNRKTMVDFDNKLTRYAYDAANRFLTITDPQSLITKYSYDKYGNLASSLYPNKTGVIYKYDSLNRLAKVVNQKSVSPYTKLSEFTYSYDKLYRKIKAKTLDATINYSYDALGRLIQEKRTSSISPYQITYSYDAAGNRLTKNQSGTVTNYIYNQLNELTKETTGSKYTNYYYDLNGNLVKETPNSGNSVSYYYDSLNRLNKVTGPNLNEIYKYDGTGNRAQISSSGIITNFLYDGSNAIIERNVSQATNRSYVRNPGVGGGISGIIKRSAPSTSDMYYHYDAQGSVTETSNPSSVKLNAYVYDSFGSIVKSTATTPNNRQFLTKEQDKTGLVYFGKRYYNSSIGRFITPDPSGMVDGPNLYVYCNNDPVNFVDLWGLCEEKSFWDKSVSEVWEEWIYNWQHPKKLELSDEELINLVIGFSGGIKSSGKGGKIIIGETSERFAKKALKIGAERYVPRKEVAEIGIKKALRNNYQWLRRKFMQGYEIIDEGLDPKRVGKPGIFYEAETRWRKLWKWGE